MTIGLTVAGISTSKTGGRCTVVRRSLGAFVRISSWNVERRDRRPEKSTCYQDLRLGGAQYVVERGRKPSATSAVGGVPHCFSCVPCLPRRKHRFFRTFVSSFLGV